MGKLHASKMATFQIWNVEVKIPQIFLTHGDNVGLQVKEMLDRLRDDLERIDSKTFYRNKPKIEVRTYLVGLKT